MHFKSLKYLWKKFLAFFMFPVSKPYVSRAEKHTVPLRET